MSTHPPLPQWRLHLDDMIGLCTQVLATTRGITQTQLLADVARLQAAVHTLELISTAAGHIPEYIRAASPTIHWRMVIATCKQLKHSEQGVDTELLWSIVDTDIPTLLISLQALKATLAP
jgi:uncharacterized protein with HEPN domain